jgi:hypothetical protein
MLTKVKYFALWLYVKYYFFKQDLLEMIQRKYEEVIERDRNS